MPLANLLSLKKFLVNDEFRINLRVRRLETKVACDSRRKKSILLFLGNENRKELNLIKKRKLRRTFEEYYRFRNLLFSFDFNVQTKKKKKTNNFPKY